MDLSVLRDCRTKLVASDFGSELEAEKSLALHKGQVRIACQL